MGYGEDCSPTLRKSDSWEYYCATDGNVRFYDADFKELRGTISIMETDAATCTAALRRAREISENIINKKKQVYSREQEEKEKKQLAREEKEREDARKIDEEWDKRIQDRTDANDMIADDDWERQERVMASLQMYEDMKGKGGR